MADIWGVAAHGDSRPLLGRGGLPHGAVRSCRFSRGLIGTTFAPIIKHANQHGVSPWLASILIVSLIMAGAALAVILLAAPITEWIGRAPEIGASIKQRLYVLDRPLAALHGLEFRLRPAEPAVAVGPSNISMVTPLAAAVTPAVAESVLFFASLIFFMAGQLKFRRYLAAFFETRDGKLRFIRIANDIEHNLASYGDRHGHQRRARRSSPAGLGSSACRAR